MKTARSTLGAVALALLLGPGLALVAAESAPAKRAARRPARPPAPKRVTSAAGPVSFAREIAPVLLKYCGGCHGEKQEIAGIGFHRYRDEASVVQARGIWEKVAQSLHTHHMPPKNMPQPSPAERARVVGWIQAKLAQVDCDLKDPGRVTMRRLNRAEYNNTIRDLVGVDFRPADDFPSDDVGYGFDNIGDVLTLSPLLMEKYLAAAEKITEAAIVTPDPRTQRLEAERIPETGGDGVVQGGVRMLHSNGQVFADLELPKTGEYVLRVRAWAQQAGSEPARMTLRLDTTDLATLDVTASESEPKLYEHRFHAPAGRHRLAAAFVNDFYDPRSPDPKNRDRNLAVDFLEVAGPMGQPAQEPTAIHRRLLPCTGAHAKHTEACARAALARFARRAYRRPVTPAEVERLVRIVRLAQKEGDSFERGFQLAMQAVLVSPHFLFRVELDRNPRASSAVRPLNDWELASRLSYFLWSSMPDDELFALAEKGRLKDPAVLRAQAVRMLRHPKSAALVENFGMQWLTLRNLQNFSPDPKLFPQWDEELRSAMLTETRLFFQAIVRENRSILDFLDANFTYLNERLAKHYGIDWVKGNHFRKVILTGELRKQRGGILTHASVLAVTSNPTRTSPVKRGKWVLEQILNTPPPPPAPNVPPLADDTMGAILTGTLRQRMEQHRKDPMCASCHEQMDAIGFGLENFDAIGAWRNMDNGAPIDASGKLADGKSFEGPAQLSALLKTRKDQFARALVDKLLTYALGRGLEPYDRCNVDAMVRAIARKNYRFGAIVEEIVQSEPFRMRRGEGGV